MADIRRGLRQGEREGGGEKSYKSMNGVWKGKSCGGEGGLLLLLLFSEMKSEGDG